jgi:hypothetical protein
MLESRFVKTSALIVDIKGVSPLAQKSTQSRVKANTICIACREITSIKLSNSQGNVFRNEFMTGKG